MKLVDPQRANLRNHLEDIMPRGIEGKAETPKAEWGEPKDSDIWRQKKKNRDGTLKRIEGIFLGYYNGKNIFWNDDRHLFLCSGNRSGKGVSCIIPNLYIYENSVLVIDPKGENARKTIRRRRALKQDVVILDPFNTTGFFGEESGEESSRYNPLSMIKPNNQDDAISIAEDIASSIVIGDKGKNSHFTDKARSFLKSLILLVTIPPHDNEQLFAKNEQHLGTVRELFNLTHSKLQNEKGYKDDPRKALFNFMKVGGTGWYDDIVAATANQYLGNDSDEARAVFSSLGNQLEFLDLPKMRKVLESSDDRLEDFKFENMKGKPTSLFICLPASKMETHSRWLRMLIRLSLRDFVNAHDSLKQKDEEPVPVLMVLDEFPVLGHMAAIQTAAGFIAGYGVKMWFIVQNISQLKQHYGDSWETFVGNCGVQLFFGNTEPSTLEYVTQKKLGRVGMTTEEIRRSSYSANSGSPIKEEYRNEGLLSSDEFERRFRREGRLMLVLAAGEKPVALQRAIYYEELKDRATGEVYKDYFKKYDNGEV